jgi:hypothetical protein
MGTLRAVVEERKEAALSWQAIGTELGGPKEMHWSGVDVVYAFRSQNGNWFGPHTALPNGEFTDGTLHFEPAQPTNPFVGQVLTMRFGPQERDVSAHACQVTLPDGSPRHVRVTHAVLDFMFGDGQTPLRQAVAALTHAAIGNPRVPALLQAVIGQAARMMTLAVPVERLTTAVDRVVAIVGPDAADENVAAAIRRLEPVALEYRMWVKVRGR